MELICPLGIFLVVGAILFIWASMTAQAKAKKAYLESLALLRESPHDPDLRSRTLALGRQYIATLGNNATSVFSEVALGNDITAACARAGSIPVATVATPQPVQAQPTTADRLRELERLKADGLITEAEYADRRAAILATL